MATAKDLMQKNFISVNMSDSISEFIGKTKQKGQSFALVFENKKYKGLVDKRFLLTSRIDSSKMKIRNIIKKRSKSKTQFFVPTLSPDTDVKEICRLMATANVRVLPVVEKQQAIGIVNAIDVLDAIKKEYKGISVAELVSKKLVVANENDEIGRIIKELHVLGIDRVPVVDKFNKLIGLATLNDLIKRFHIFIQGQAQKMPSAGSKGLWKNSSWGTGEKQDMLKLPIRNIMTQIRQNCVINAKTSINEAIKIMMDEDVSSIIIAENQTPVGILTIKDILEDYAK